MKIQIKKNVLSDALNLIAGITSKSSTDPVVNTVFIESDGGQSITIKATNHKHSFIGNFSAVVDKKCAFCVNSAKLFRLTKAFRGDEIEIELTKKKWIFISCEKSKVRLPCIDSGIFPEIQFNELDHTIKLPGEVMIDAITKIQFAVGENISRISLTGMNMRIDDGITWTGADAYRISRLTTKIKTYSKSDIIIPKNSLPEIKKIVELYSGDILLSYSENTFQISIGDVKFKTQLIGSDYPSIDKLLGDEGLSSIIVGKQKIIDSVSLINTVTDGDVNSIMKLTVQKGKVLFESQQMEFGHGNDEIDCEYSGEEISIGLNTKYFLDAVDSFSSADDDKIILMFNTPNTPVLLKCTGWSDYLNVLMPVRIQW